MDGEADTITFRPQTTEDLPFIHNSWGESIYRGSPAYRALTPAEFHSFHRPTRERFFAKPNTAVIVAVNPNDHWQILGWIAVEKIPSGIILQYVYVKSIYKRRGLAKELVKRAIPGPPVFYTHFTDRASKIIGHKADQLRGWRFVPYLV